MKKISKFELVSFTILIISFILFMIGSFTETPFISENKNIFQFTIYIALIAFSIGMVLREKKNRGKKDSDV